MRKFLLVVLATVLVGGSVRAEGVAGGVAPEPEPGVVSQVTEGVLRCAERLKGVALGSLVRKGMAEDQVRQVLGRPTGVAFGCGPARILVYSELGLTVDTTPQMDAGGGSGTFRVSSVLLHSPLFR
jgi:hypothetical protein